MLILLFGFFFGEIVITVIDFKRVGLDVLPSSRASFLDFART